MIKDLIEGKTATERAQIKSTEIAKINFVGTHTSGDLTIEILSLNPIEVNGQHGVELYAKAWDKGEPIGFVDGTVETEHFRIFNPPIRVPDGTKKLVQGVGPDGKPHVFEEDNFKEDLQEAVLQSLEHTIKVLEPKLPKGKIIAGKVGSTVSTFYPDGTGSTDVNLFEDTAGQSWATKIAAAGINGNFLGSNVTAIQYVAAGGTSNQWAQLRRGVMTFETAAIDSGDTVSAAVFSLWAKGMFSSGITCSIAMDEFLGSQTDTFDGTEYGIRATFWAGNRYGTSDITIAGWGDGAYEDFTLSTFTPIKKGVGAVTKLGTRMAEDMDGDTGPTWSASATTGFQWAGYITADTTNDPKLVVTHAAAAGAANHWLLMGA